MPPDAASGPAEPLKPSAVVPDSTLSVADPGDCTCGCCAALIKALAGIRTELSRIRERLDQGESERAGWPS